MNPAPTAADPDRRRILAFVLLSGACIFATYGMRPLEEHDSLRFPEVAREILETGDWAVLHLHGAPYLLKPPLQFWIVALFAQAAGGVHPWVARLPSALAGWGMVLLVAWIGRRLAGARAGLLSAVILGTGVLFFTMSQMTRLDPLYSFFTVAAMALWLRWREQQDAFRGARGAARAAAVFACLGLATLVKGPMALLFVLPVIGADSALRRDGSFFRPLPLAAGIGVYLALLLPWFLPVIGQVGWQEARELYEGEIADRVKGGQNYDQPWWHYLRGLPIDFLPWSWAFLAAAWIAWREQGKPSPVPRVLLLWCALPVLLLSLAVSKNTRYLLPCFPAFALVTGILLARVWEEADLPDILLAWWARLVPIAIIVCGAGLPFWFWNEGPPWWAWAAGLVGIAGSAWVLAGDRRRQFTGAIVWTAVLAFGWYQVRSLNLTYRESPRGSYARAAERILAGAGSRPLVSWKFGEESLEFYCRQIVPQADDPAELLELLKARPGAMVIAEPAGVPALEGVPGFRFETRAHVPDRRKQPFVLLEPVPVR